MQSFKNGLIITRWLKRIEPKTEIIRPWRKIDTVSLARDIREYPDAYLYERAARLNASRNGVFEALSRMGVTYRAKPIHIDKWI